MKKYRKKPVVIEAVQWTGLNLGEIKSFVGESLVIFEGRRYLDVNCVNGTTSMRKYPNTMIIKTLEGDHRCTIGDYIIKGVNGEFYPCKPDIFEKTYDEVSDD